VREALERGEAVEVPGMGTFRVEHRTSELDQQDDGNVAVRPPRDQIGFDPAT